MSDNVRNPTDDDIDTNVIDGIDTNVTDDDIDSNTDKEDQNDNDEQVHINKLNIENNSENDHKKCSVCTIKQAICMVFIAIVGIAIYSIGEKFDWKLSNFRKWFLPPIDITLHCPDEVYHIQIPKSHFEIDASHPEHTKTTVSYKWTRLHRTEMEYVPRVKDDKAILKFIKVQSVGEYIYKLDMQVPAPNNKIKTRQCSVTVKFMDLPTLGIDLGTTFSCIAYRNTVKETIFVEIQTEYNEKWEYCIPSAIYFPKDSNKPIKVGYDALLYNFTDPINVIYDIKRIVGRRSDEKEVKEFIKT
eukprot:521620_1